MLALKSVQSSTAWSVQCQDIFMRFFFVFFGGILRAPHLQCTVPHTKPAWSGTRLNWWDDLCDWAQAPRTLTENVRRAKETYYCNDIDESASIHTLCATRVKMHVLIVTCTINSTGAHAEVTTTLSAVHNTAPTAASGTPVCVRVILPRSCCVHNFKKASLKLSNGILSLPFMSFRARYPSK